MARTPQDPYQIPTIQPNLIAAAYIADDGDRTELLNAIPTT